MNCTGCEHLELRYEGECGQLRGSLICGGCLKTYPLVEIRCSCGLASQKEAGILEADGDDFKVSAFCPLNNKQRAELMEKQKAPKVVPLVQKGLF